MRQLARELHRGAAARDPGSLRRLRALPELRALDDAALAGHAQRRHALAALARELGFAGWPAAKALLCGEAVRDYGSVMFRESGGALWNIWSADYAEAREIRSQHGGFLVAYRWHFVFAGPELVELIGLDPDDPDWQRIGRDWVRPADRDAWTRLTELAVVARLHAVA